jgi:hypothetical protein
MNRAWCLGWFGAIFLVMLGSMMVGDWWSMRNDAAWSPARLLLYRSAGAAFLSISLTVLLSWVWRLDRNWRAVWALWAAYLAVLAFATWPGYLMSDSIAAFKYGNEFPVVQWLGFFTPFLYATIIGAIPHIGAVTVFQLLVCASVVVYCGETLFQITHRLMAPTFFFVLIAVAPAVIYNFLLLSRDTPFSLLAIWLVAFYLRQYHGRTDASHAFGVAGFVAGCVVTLRGDGWLVLLPLICILWWTVKERRKLALFVAAAASTFVVYGVALPAIEGNHADRFGYQVANTLNPLGYVLQSPRQQDPAGFLEVVSRVVDIDKVRQEQTPFEINSWWSGGVIRPQVSEDDQRAYLRAVGGYISQNVGVYLAGRVETFFAASGFSRIGFRYKDSVAEGWPVAWVPPERFGVILEGGRPLPGLFAVVDRWFRASTEYHPGRLAGSTIYWNLLPGLIILTLCLFGYGVLPSIALASLVVLLRVPAVFLLAPASQFKYYLSVDIGAAFLLAAAIGLLLRKRRPGSNWQGKPLQA